MAKIVLARNLSAASDSVTATQGPPGAQPWLVGNRFQLVPAQYDHMTLGYHPSKPLVTSVVYRQGGGSGTIVATLTMTYDANDNISTVART